MAPVPMAVRGLNGEKRKISRGVTRVLTGVEIAKVMEPCIHVQRSRSLERHDLERARYFARKTLNEKKINKEVHERGAQK